MFSEFRRFAQTQKGRTHVRPASLSINRKLDQPTLVPHSSQNFAPGLSSCWQFEHFAGACEVPHSLQNFEPAGIAAPHFTHFAPPTAAAPEAPAPPVDSELCFIASDMAPAIALPIANPAPSPAPVAAPPPPVFWAASRIASAAWNCA
jgi:hypothetical protein